MLLYILATALSISFVRASSDYAPPLSGGYVSQATRCAEKLFGVLDGLAKYYCRTRYVRTSELDFMEQEYELYSTLDTVESLSECAYGNYNFLHGVLPTPGDRGNAEADKMLTACLVQQAALRFLNSSPDKAEARDALLCPATALKLRVFEPFNQSASYIHNLDFDGMLQFIDGRPPCLAAVLSSFARQYLYRIALAQPPPKPSGFAAFQGFKLITKEYDLVHMPPGVEWPMMLQILKLWSHGEVKGIIIKEEPEDILPKVVVYYEIRS